MKNVVLLCLVLLTLSFKSAVAQDDETALYSANGMPVAYLSFEAGDDEPVIYAWSGKPVAYLTSTHGEGLSVYGFNGKHLGWFVHGVVRDHDGSGACGVRAVVNSPKAEPFKAFKQFKPFKAFKQFEPTRPSFSQKWSSTTCSVFLFEGTSET